MTRDISWHCWFSVISVNNFYDKTMIRVKPFLLTFYWTISTSSKTAKVVSWVVSQIIYLVTREVRYTNGGSLQKPSRYFVDVTVPWLQRFSVICEKFKTKPTVVFYAAINIILADVLKGHVIGGIWSILFVPFIFRVCWLWIWWQCKMQSLIRFWTSELAAYWKSL